MNQVPLRIFKTRQHFSSRIALWSLRSTQYRTWPQIQVPYKNDAIIGVLRRYCTVTLIVVVWAMLADWAVTMIEAVPRFACILLPYPPPPQPPIASTSTTIASDAAAARIEVRLWFCNFPPHSIARG